MTVLLEHHPLDALNTLGFSGRAERYAEAPDEAALLALLERADAAAWDVFVLGGGSNVVLAGDVPGLVVRLTGDAVSTSTADADGSVRVTAEAGVGWHELVERTLALGLGGLENLSLIPGSVGAAPIQNIGAYGVELAERLVGVRAWHRPSRRFVELGVSDCAFGYRDSRFKRERGDWIVTAATFELGPHRPVVADYASLAEELARRGVRAPTARDVADAVVAVRRRRLPDPAVIGNVGSFFHNPVVTVREADALAARFPGLVRYPQADGRVKLAAGWLIDRLGFRGHREHGVGVHAEQALVLVNAGGGDGEALLALVARIVAAVEARYGIRLEIEPTIVGGRDRARRPGHP